MLRKLGGIWDRGLVKDERFGVEVFQSILPPSFDGESEGVNVLVSGNFDPETLVEFISQDPAVDGEVGVRHYGWECGVGS